MSDTFQLAFFPLVLGFTRSLYFICFDKLQCYCMFHKLYYYVCIFHNENLKSLSHFLSLSLNQSLSFRV